MEAVGSQPIAALPIAGQPPAAAPPAGPPDFLFDRKPVRTVIRTSLSG